MAKNSEKKISIRAFDDVMKKNFSDNEVTKEWFGLEVKIKKTINLTEMLGFADEVANSCFSADGRYLPEVMDFAIKCNLMTRYANFALPNDLDHRYEMVYKTDIVDVILSEINKVQLEEIVKGINRKVKNLCDVEVSALQQKLMSVTSMFENMQTQMEEMFGGVNPDDIANLVGAVSNGEIDEEKIVKAFINNKVDEDGEE